MSLFLLLLDFYESEICFKGVSGLFKTCFKNEVGQLQNFKKKGEKYKPKTKIMLILRLFCRSVEISGQKYFGFENFQYFTERTQNKKKG